MEKEMSEDNVRIEYDEKGYDANGLDIRGFDKRGVYCKTNTLYDEDGFDVQGYNRRGFNKDGIHKNGTRFTGFHRAGIIGKYDIDGYDESGFNWKGFDKNGIHKNGTRFDEFGNDITKYQDEITYFLSGANMKTPYFSEDLDEYGFNKINHQVTGTAYDVDGYNRKGRNKEGYDRQGFNKKGYDKDGFNKEGINERGFKRDGIHKNGTRFDGSGRDIDGYDKYGFKGRIHRNGTEYDDDGYKWDGYKRVFKDGVYIDMIGRDGFNQVGRDLEGYNKAGYNWKGFNREGIHCVTGTKYNPKGFDEDGYDEKGYDKDKFDRNGISIAGLRKEECNSLGFNMDGIHKNTGKIYSDENLGNILGITKNGMTVFEITEDSIEYSNGKLEMVCWNGGDGEVCKYTKEAVFNSLEPLEENTNKYQKSYINGEELTLSNRLRTLEREGVVVRKSTLLSALDEYFEFYYPKKDIYIYEKLYEKIPNKGGSDIVVGAYANATYITTPKKLKELKELYQLNRLTKQEIIDLLDGDESIKRVIHDKNWASNIESILGNREKEDFAQVVTGLASKKVELRGKEQEANILAGQYEGQAKGDSDKDMDDDE